MSILTPITHAVQTDPQLTDYRHGRQLYAAGYSDSECHGYWQLAGWTDAASCDNGDGEAAYIACMKEQADHDPETVNWPDVDRIVDEFSRGTWA